MKGIICYGHQQLKEHVSKTSITIDATAGNGYDTLFLAQISKKVFAFDIQEKALIKTKTLLDAHQIENVVLIKDSHEYITQYVSENVDAVVFNLGYLPKSDKSITTQASSTLKAIDEALSILSLKGIILITVYVGHLQGKNEAGALQEYLTTLSENLYRIKEYRNKDKPLAPYVIYIQRAKI